MIYIPYDPILQPTSMYELFNRDWKDIKPSYVIPMKQTRPKIHIDDNPELTFHVPRLIPDIVFKNSRKFQNK